MTGKHPSIFSRLRDESGSEDDDAAFCVFVFNTGYGSQMQQAVGGGVLRVKSDQSLKAL